MYTTMQMSFASEARRPPGVSRRDPADEQYLLVRELTHRFNNELASITAFVSLTAARSPFGEVKRALDAVLHCIYEIGLVQRSLHVPSTERLVDGALYLRELCESIGRAKLEHRGIELTLIECPLELQTFDCWRVGMIVAELINNAARHAFGDSGGRIRVEMCARGGWVHCSVIDDGRGLAGSAQGNGATIVQSLVGLLGGQIEYCSGPIGTTVQVSFPASGAVAADVAARVAGSPGDPYWNRDGS